MASSNLGGYSNEPLMVNCFMSTWTKFVGTGA